MYDHRSYRYRFIYLFIRNGLTHFVWIGLLIPTWKPSIWSAGNCTSPSGAISTSWECQPGFKSSIISCNFQRVEFQSQPRQWTWWAFPCSSVTRRLPDLKWRASTFWVTNQLIFPRLSQSQSTWCDTLGLREENVGQPTKFRAQYLCRSLACFTKSEYWTGLLVLRAYSPTPSDR